MNSANTVLAINKRLSTSRSRRSPRLTWLLISVNLEIVQLGHAMYSPSSLLWSGTADKRFIYCTWDECECMVLGVPFVRFTPFINCFLDCSHAGWFRDWVDVNKSSSLCRRSSFFVIQGYRRKFSKIWRNQSIKSIRDKTCWPSRKCRPYRSTQEAPLKRFYYVLIRIHRRYNTLLLFCRLCLSNGHKERQDLTTLIY